MNRPRRHTAKYLIDTKRRTIAGPNAEAQQSQKNRKKDKEIPPSNSEVLKPAVSIKTASTKGERKEVGVGEQSFADEKVAQDQLRPEDPAQTLTKDVNRKSSHLVTYPDDILSIIFESYVDILGNPWALMQVCRRWRHVATLTRRIWSGILIAYTTPTVSHSSFPCDERRYQGYEICNTVQRLSSALARAARGPLDICFKLSTIRGWAIDPSVKAEAFLWECVDLLRTSQAYLRIRCLETPSASASWMDSLGLNNFEFIALESALVGMSALGLCRQIQLTAKRIHTLVMRQDFGRSFSWDLQVLPNLQNLEILGRASQNEGRELHRLLRGGAHLVDLSLSTLEVSGDGPLSFPSLQTLKLCSVQFGCMVNLPSLRSLEMSFSSVLSTGVDSIDLPSLTSLELYGSTPHRDVRIRAPALNNLQVYLYSQQDESVPHLQDHLEEIIKPAFGTLRRVELQGDFETSTTLVDLLDRCVSLEELHISRCRIKKSFFEALGGCLLPPKPDSLLHKAPIITSLKAFHLDLRDVKHAPTRTASAKWARMAVRARGQGGYPLNEASIRIEALGTPTSILD
ncbi:hypothetical protein FRC17_004178 [Serendipita sp. 399]|nr:hypothetical protein FRC17_004178 [Serendipita sp. 399]